MPRLGRTAGRRRALCARAGAGWGGSGRWCWCCSRPAASRCRCSDHRLSCSAGVPAATPPAPLAAPQQPSRLRLQRRRSRRRPLPRLTIPAGSAAGPDRRSRSGAARALGRRAPADMLPRIGADGRMPMQVYAAGFDPAIRRPRVGAAAGRHRLRRGGQQLAIHALPAAVTLAVSPYAPDPAEAAGRRAAAGHEILVSIPMEPEGYPLNDPGPRALLTSLAGAERTAAGLGAVALRRLCRRDRRARQRMRGERFAALPTRCSRCCRAGRARPAVCRSARWVRRGSPSGVGRRGRRGDRRSAVTPAIDAKLAELEQLAHETAGGARPGRRAAAGDDGARSPPGR